MKPRATALLSLLLIVSACGDTRVERAGSGAALGATVGLAVGVLCCGDPFVSPKVGGLIGAGVGGITGAVLSEPLFFNHEAQYWPYDMKQD